MLTKRLNIDVANRSKRHSPAGCESVDEALAFNFRSQLLMNGQHCFGANHLKLELTFVVDAITELDLILLFALHEVAHQQTAGGQRMMAARADLGQSQIFVPEKNQMAIAGDI